MLTFIVKNATVFQCQNASLSFLQALKVMADFETLQILCHTNRQQVYEYKYKDSERTFCVVVTQEELVHILQLLLALLRQLLLLLLAALDPLYGVIYVRFGIAKCRALQLRVELPLVSHPKSQEDIPA